MLLLSLPKDGTKRDFAVFACKIKLLWKEVCYKFLCVKTSGSKDRFRLIVPQQ